MARRFRALATAFVLALGPCGGAGAAPVDRADATTGPARVTTTLPDVQVTATRAAHPRRSTPAAIAVLEGEALRGDRRGVALSEPLAQVPGVLARQRNNFAQDEQVSIRGFGARATFGIRGVRLYQDGIPATMPDGQGQVSHFNLGGAARIEVLRGPFSALYGNAAGGVVQVFTADGRDAPGVRADLRLGSDGFRRVASSYGASGARTDLRLDAARFDTDGFRDHSRAQRTSLNAKLEVDLGQRRTLRLLANGLDAPDVDDPLGLTAAQMAEDPRQATAAAHQFDTRKSVRQAQAGALLDWPTGDDDALRVSAWTGDRHVEQVLSVPVAAQGNPLSGGGVVVLASPYRGVDANWEWHAMAGATPIDVVVGIDRERQVQHRRGFENFVGDTTGVRGALRRDEHDRVDTTDLYVQAGWQPHPDWSLHAGLRQSRVRFRADDDYVTGANPDDSGRRGFRALNPVAGASWRFRPDWHAYVAAGRGLETPTFDELGYRPDGAAGLNLELRPARTRSAEAGLKWDAGDARRAEFALFRADTRDELAVASNAGGRSTYRNAGGARREGVEVSAQWPLRAGGRVLAAYTFLRATYRDGFLTCAASPCTSPTAVVPPGTRIPGLPRSVLAVQARWGGETGWSAHAGAQVVDAVPVANVGDARAAGHATLDAGVAYGFARGRVFLAAENLADRRYAGSVIVNEANGRYFEPASGRTWLVGVELRLDR